MNGKQFLVTMQCGAAVRIWACRILETVGDFVLIEDEIGPCYINSRFIVMLREVLTDE